MYETVCKYLQKIEVVKKLIIKNYFRLCNNNSELFFNKSKANKGHIWYKVILLSISKLEFWWKIRPPCGEFPKFLRLFLLIFWQLKFVFKLTNKLIFSLNKQITIIHTWLMLSMHLLSFKMFIAMSSASRSVDRTLNDKNVGVTSC